MKILLVHPGASFSTHDVYAGYAAALRRAGVTVLEYLLDQRIDEAADYLHWRDQRLALRHKRQPVAPTQKQVLSKASADIPGMALYHAVDGVVIVSCMYLDPDVLVLLHRAGIPTALILTESPYDDEPQATRLPFVDLAFTNERSTVAELRRANPNVHYLPHAYDPERHRPGAQPGDNAVQAHDVVFVGTDFEERIQLLEAVDWSGIDLGLYGVWESVAADSPLRPFIRNGPINNATTAALYRRATIGLNLYRTSRGYGRGVPHIENAESLNPRALELAACGCFHLSEDRREVWETFGTAVPVFGSARSLRRKLDQFLANPMLRHNLAAMLPDLVADRTFDHMARTILLPTIEATWRRRAPAA